MELAKEQLIEMYKKMVKIRKFEERVIKLFSDGKIPGFVHLYIGEEATGVGACSAIDSKDYITSTHRGHGHLLAKGGRVDLMMAEILGKATGYCKGKGGSMHIADVDLGILGANGIVGGGFTIAAGAGLSAKMRGTEQVVLCFFGDGASNQTTFHEGINMAAIWSLPVVFICENNQYGISLHQSKHQRITDVSDRAVAYGIPGITIDGNDVIAVNEAVNEAVKRARKGEGPTLIECKTYRHRGHFEGDPVVYRTQEEFKKWLKEDPIPRFEKKLVEMGALSKEDVKQIDGQAEKIIDDAVKFAEESPEPELKSSVEDVYTDIIEEVRQ